ncbi:DNA methyltransferase [Lactobacillus sp. M0396]|uniref:DNA methyltransferase n=1 Tax=Lactobacillus sp. M0396 TaxID=2751030 RepID=UPI0018DE7930|nr:DNA methyltransferase [Lactobacillus sp. M0396]MBI0033853.1 class I SAM-dependent DNA methyltransferase [Lactobacillus sp. M0396]
MDVATQKKNAKKFINDWKNRGREKQDSQSFWLALLHNVLDVEKPENFIHFEEKVHLEHDSFIDAYIDQTHVMIEQKGSNKNLDKPIRQSDKTSLTPFQQAQRYSAGLPYSKRPRWIVTCNFKEFRVYDMEHPNSEPDKIELKNLENEYYRLDFLVDKSNQNLEKEKQVSIEAGELVGQIYDELLKQYKDPDSEFSQKSINQLCVRIVFCLYAEDAGIFGRRNMFHDYLKDFDAHHFRSALINLFKVLDTKVENRDPYLADDEPVLAEFPYVNGGMFSDEKIEIPSFTDELRDLLLNKASNEFDWSEISPTIFGAVFESTLNPETRRQGGMHYTSVENIHKVIDPLFLDDLKDEFNEIKKTKQPATLKKKAKAFQDKIANLTFFDPACGSGNFLTETYLQLRKLENEAIKLIYGDNVQLDVGQQIVEVTIQNFYGIEINDFAVSVAKTALWIAESQMLEETKEIVYANWDFLPLKTYSHIHEGNALTMDWNVVLPNYACHYIMGNPPFIGTKYENKNQKTDINNLNHNLKGIDYVSGWYYKAIEYIQDTKIECCYVSTNSITQGQQVAILWSILLKLGIKINFAYRTFIWTSEASQKAHVHCVIIGFSLFDRKKKFLYENGLVSNVSTINPYLVDGPNILIKSRSKPLSNVLKMIKGSQPTDGGNLILNESEKSELIKSEPKSKKYIRRYMGANDLIKDKCRYCLWLKDCTPNDLKNMPLILKRLKLVQSSRLNSKKAATQKWAKLPSLFTEDRQPNNDYLMVPVVSSEQRRYIPMAFVSKDVIANTNAQMIPNAGLYEFAILESNMHMGWMRTVAGRMKSDYAYSAKIVYNNFPWPSPTDKQKEKITNTAQEILDARALYPKDSLADLYDPLTMPPELLKAHQNNDRAVMEAYGLPVKTTTESDAVAFLFDLYSKLIKSKDN